MWNLFHNGLLQMYLLSLVGVLLLLHMPTCWDMIILLKCNCLHLLSFSLLFASSRTRHWMPLMVSKPEEQKVDHLLVSYLITDVILFHWHFLCWQSAKLPEWRRMKYFWFSSWPKLLFGHLTGPNITLAFFVQKLVNSV